MDDWDAVSSDRPIDTNDWDAVSNDTQPDSTNNPWDAVSTVAPTIARKQQPHRSRAKTHEGGRSVMQRGLKGLSIAIIVLCIAVIGLSAFSALNIFHVTNFNILNAIVTARHQIQGNTAASDIPLLVQQSTSGTPSIDDPLTDNRNNWAITQYSGLGKCTVSDGALHITQTQSNYALLCNSTGIPQLNSFALQIDMDIVQGSEGGIVFGQSSTAYFTLAISSDGSYFLDGLTDSWSMHTIEQSNSFAIKKGLNQPNQITIIEKGTDFYFYANNQLVVHERLDYYSGGGTALIAISSQQALDVAFSNLKVWKL